MYIPQIQRFDLGSPDAHMEGASGAVPQVHHLPHPAPSPRYHPDNIRDRTTTTTTMLQHHILTWFILSCLPYIQSGIPSTSSPTPTLQKRTTDPNTVTGVVVGVLLSAFVIGAGFFLYVYGRRLRFRRRSGNSRRRGGGGGGRRYHHRHSHVRASKSSGSSDASAAGGGGGRGGGGGGEDEGERGGDENGDEPHVDGGGGGEGSRVEGEG
ncbi:hypothetical protein F5Y17DRAFT_21760 [Xylariaceae sp. FL0594]|nr:hypothetical protein F5Y17DRAFT_21760 [Xylariaceae sp. FL0594]